MQNSACILINVLRGARLADAPTLRRSDAPTLRRSDAKGVTHLLSVVKAFAALILLLFFAFPVAAQNPVIQGNLYYYTSAATINTDVSNNTIVVGKMPDGQFGNIFGDTNLGTTDATAYTVTVAEGAKITAEKLFSGTGYPFGLDVYNHNVINFAGGISGFVNAGNHGGVNSYNVSTINFSGGDINVLGSNDASTINITGGSVYSARINDSSIVNISGGTVQNFVAANNSSALNISGGVIESAEANDTSIVNISGGEVTVVGTAAPRQSYSVVNISGGTIGIANADHASVFNIRGGSLGKINASFTNITNLYGGVIGDIFTDDSSIANLYGGVISADTIYHENDAASVNFFGLSVAFSNALAGVDPLGHPGIFYDVAWVQSNGFRENTRYFDRGGNINNPTPRGFTFTPLISVPAPEPGTLALLLPFAAGVLVWRKRGVK